MRWGRVSRANDRSPPQSRWEWISLIHPADRRVAYTKSSRDVRERVTGLSACQCLLALMWAEFWLSSQGYTASNSARVPLVSSFG